MVSVPCVTTTPSQPSRMPLCISSASACMSEGEMARLGICSTSATRISARSSAPGAEDSSSAADLPGAFRPHSSGTPAIVPPSDASSTVGRPLTPAPRGRAGRRSSRLSGQAWRTRQAHRPGRRTTAASYRAVAWQPSRGSSRGPGADESLVVVRRCSGHSSVEISGISVRTASSKRRTRSCALSSSATTVSL
jgi:hypothetical protein